MWDQGVVVGLEHERLASTGPFDAWTERCDGGASITGSHDVVGYSSPHYSRGVQRAQPGGALEGVRSVVYVFGSDTDAQHELAVLASARALACVQRDDGETTSPGSETHLKVSSLPIAGGFSAKGVRWSAVPSSYRPPRRRYQDLVAFTRGRALIVIHTTSTAMAKYTPHPFPAALEERLLGLLYSRARSHNP